MENWLAEQEGALVDAWDGAIDRHYPGESQVWNDPEAHYSALTNQWNLLAAVELVDWPALLDRRGLRVLDLGCGTGWLSAFLSRFDAVQHVDALDSSRRNLTEMLPRITELMGGAADKIRPVHGLFYPLPVEAASYDMIVASSAVHHAPSLSSLLEGCHRALKDGGAFVILNETPISTPLALLRTGKMGVRIAVRIAAGRYDSQSRSVSAGGLLYDPHLGDLAYSLAQWKDAFQQTGWRWEVVETPLGSRKTSGPRETRLTHFILRKA